MCSSQVPVGYLPDGNVDLGPVKCSVPRVQLPDTPSRCREFVQGVGEFLLSLVPSFKLAEIAFRARRELQLECEAKAPVHLDLKFQSACISPEAIQKHITVLILSRLLDLPLIRSQRDR